MSQGMSENEVKKKLYGEFTKEGGGLDKAKPQRPAHKTGTKSPHFLSLKAVPIKSISIFALAFVILIGIIIVAANRSRARVEPVTIREAEQIKGYLIQGKKYYSDEMYDEAILIWKNVLEISPDHRSALRYIQRAELKKKELKIREEEIARKLKEMLARREKEENERKLQGEMKLLKQKTRKEVKELLREGDALYRKGDFSGAIIAYKEVLTLSPGNSHAARYIDRAQKEIPGEKGLSVAPEGEKISEEVSPDIKKEDRYGIQVAAYSGITYAEKSAKKLINQGYKNVAIKKGTSPSGKTLYLIYLGPFNNKNEASTELERIKKEGFKDSFIKAIK